MYTLYKNVQINAPPMHSRILIHGRKGAPPGITKQQCVIATHKQ